MHAVEPVLMQIMSNDDRPPSPANSFKNIGRKLGLDCCFPTGATQPIEFHPVSIFSSDYKSKREGSLSGSRLSLADSFSNISDKVARLIPKNLRKSKSAFLGKKDSERSRLLRNDQESSSCSSSDCEKKDAIKMDSVKPVRENLRKSKPKTKSAKAYRNVTIPKSPVALFDHKNQKVTIKNKMDWQCGDSVNINPKLMTKDSDTGMMNAPKEMAWTAHTPPSEYLNKDERKLWNQMTQLSHERFSATFVRLQQYFATTNSNDSKIKTSETFEQQKAER